MRPHSMQPALDVYTTCCEVWTCALWPVVVMVNTQQSVVISRHCRENRRTLCNFSICMVADVGLYKKAVQLQRNRAMPL